MTDKSYVAANGSELGPGRKVEHGNALDEARMAGRRGTSARSMQSGAETAAPD